MKTKIELCGFADEAGSSIEEQIAALKRNNIHFLEIRSVDGKNVSELTNEEAKILFKKLKQNRIKVFSIGSPLGKVDISVSEDEFMKSTTRICELAKIFKAKNVRMFSFYNAREQKDKVVDLLKKALLIASKFRVSFCHENEKEIFGDIEPHVSELLEAVPGLEVVYDPANFVYCNQEIKESINTLIPKAKYFHIKDAILGKQVIVPPGQGDAKIEDILKLIEGKKVLTVEPHLKDFTGYGTFDKAELKNQIAFKDNNESFDYAVNALKDLLKKVGFKETKKGFEK